MPDDYAIRCHRLQISGGIKQRFTFGDAGGGNTDVNGVSRQTLSSDLKRGARAGRGFKEKVNYGAAAQRRDFFDLTPRYVAERLGRIEQMSNLTC